MSDSIAAMMSDFMAGLMSDFMADITSYFLAAPVFNCLAADLRVPICFDTLFILMSYFANCFYVLRGPGL